MDIRERYERATLVRDMYPEFADFCVDAMQYLGFRMTWMQLDMARYMQHGPANQMVSAQRGEAKSTIACLYGVWCIVQDPKTRVVLVSGGQDKAEENGKLMHGLIHNWEPLQYLIPDKYAGDRTSVLEFDVHYGLKGVDKSASVNCLGITSGLQGYRADVLIPDDVETTKNGLTATQRAHLAILTREFSSICTHGRIMYLGTPQTKDSIYNQLPARGFEVRIWPGRFPTEEQEAHYGEHLAPSILERMARLGPKCRSGGGLDGLQGWAADPERYDEESLRSKELDQGPEGFQLQYMLNTSLSDAQRMQLKLRDLIVADLDHTQVPEIIHWAGDAKYKIAVPDSFTVRNPELYRPAGMSDVFQKLHNVTMTIDPASEGGDEVAFAIGGTVGPYLHVIDWGGYKGGLSESNLDALAELVREYNVTHVRVEKNMGGGTATKVISAHFLNVQGIKGVGVDDENSFGQKERRVIDGIRPILSRHRLVMHQRALDHDQELAKQYPMDRRATYSGVFQMANITTDRGSLQKDDRIDVLEQLCRCLSGSLVIDEEKAAEHRKMTEVKEFINNPMGYHNPKPKGSKGRLSRLLNRGRT